MALKQHQRLGDSVWSRMPRVNAEIFTLTYGALVMQVRRHVHFPYHVAKLLFLIIFIVYI